MKPSQLASLLEKTISAKLPVLVTGAPGIGKSDIVKQAAEKAGADYYIEFPAISDPTDGKGLPVVGNGTGTATWLQFERHKIYCNTQKLSVVVLEDMGQAAMSVQASYMQWVLARRIGDVAISPHVAFVACTNRRTDKAGVQGLLEPVKSRFASIVNLDVDLNDWIKWALANNLPTELIAFVKFRPELLHDFKASNDLVNSPSPRTIANVGRLMGIGLPLEIEHECFAGAAGEGFAAEFRGFLQLFRTLPNPDLVFLNPTGAMVPSDPATLYALCSAISRKVTDQNISRFVQYIDRIPDEFSVFAMRAATAKKVELLQTRASIEWHSKHDDVLI